jgi:hypothetical protein
VYAWNFKKNANEISVFVIARSRDMERNKIVEVLVHGDV